MISREDLHERIEVVQERIQRAAVRGGRQAEAVQLVAVTKTQPPELIEMAYEAGLRHFGENRVEEMIEKGLMVEDLTPDATWHMIGHIQSRKTADVADSFHYVHSIDRVKIARRLSDSRMNRNTLPGLLEVNLSGEASKYGFNLSGWPDDTGLAETFYMQVGEMICFPNISLRGLMTMAPYTTEPETVRPIFIQLRLLRDVLRDRFPDQTWDQLSMGMSADFEVAIEEGATLIRLGTVLFGSRNYD